MHYSWSVTLDDQPYTIELDHGAISGKRRIRVNGVVVHESSKFIDSGTSKHPFPIGTHEGEITIESNSRGVIYNLYVDGMPQETRTWTMIRRQPFKSAKYWGGLYLFFLSGLNLLMLNLYSELAGTLLTVPSLLMVVAYVVFVYGGWRVATNRTQSRMRRVIICMALIFLDVIIITGLGISIRCGCLHAAPTSTPR